MTWPTALHLTDGIPGDGFDGWQNYWNLWWVKQAMLVEPSNPYFTTYLYAPTGVSLQFHTLNIFNGWWTLPLQLNFGLAVAYNSVVLVSFTLAGYGGYLLSLYVLSQVTEPSLQADVPTRRFAAFVGGVIFTMSPFHFAHLLGHMQVFSLIWPPFYALWLIRTLNVVDNSSHYRVSNPIMACFTTLPYRHIALCTLFLILATLVDWYHTLYLLIFTGITMLWAMWNLKTSQVSKTCEVWTPLVVVTLIGSLFALLMSPLLIPMMQNARQRPDLETGLAQNIALSADLLAFITPSEMHPLWGNWVKNLAENFSSTTSERLIFMGFIPLLLGLYIAITQWRQPLVKFWLLIGGSFFILALGPYLHIGGQIVSWGDWPLPLPYLLLYQIVPFLNLTRSLSRYDLMVMLSLGVLSSLAIVELARPRANGDTRGRVSLLTHGYLPIALPLVATVLICFEFLAAPYPISLIDTPAFFHELAQEPGDFTIAALPMNWDRPTPLLYQTVHGKRLLTAYTSRDNPLELAWRTPLLQHWRYLVADIIDQPLAEIAPTIFYDFNLRYIVLDYWQMPPGPEREGTEKWLQAAMPQATPVYNDGRLKVYRTPPQTVVQPYLSLGEGWGKHDDEPVSRVINDQAELFLHHASTSPLTLEVTAQGGGATLAIWQADQQMAQLSLTDEFNYYQMALPTLTTELVKFSFMVDKPITVSRLAIMER